MRCQMGGEKSPTERESTGRRTAAITQSPVVNSYSLISSNSTS